MNLVFRVEWWEYQTREREKSFLTQVHLLRDLYFSAIRQEHPDRNFQSSPRRINDSNRSISPLRSAKDPQGGSMKRVKGVEDLNTRPTRAQGIVGVGASVRISIALCQWPQRAGQTEIPFLKRLLQPGDEFAAEHSTEDFHGRQEGIMRLNPTFMVRGQATGRDYTMDMGMVQQVRPPGVEHA